MAAADKTRKASEAVLCGERDQAARAKAEAVLGERELHAALGAAAAEAAKGAAAETPLRKQRRC